MFMLHTKDYSKHTPKGSADCRAAQGLDVTTEQARHLYGEWGHCIADHKRPECLARMAGSGAQVVHSNLAESKMLDVSTADPSQLVAEVGKLRSRVAELEAQLDMPSRKTDSTSAEYQGTFKP
mmetsp:Transcript_105298/g.303795  ORF Transcript_105298/g.303795 Transcript_105298/m.303795 type:complete len:123 (+) Transcript_105298:834-1202(+)